MPILLQRPLNESPTSTCYVIICQRAAETAEFGSRYVGLFLLGHFTLDEASHFAIDMFDSGTVPDSTPYFDEKPNIQSIGFSTAAVPVELQHLVDNFGVMQFLHEYTFFSVSYMVANYFKIKLHHRVVLGGVLLAVESKPEVEVLNDFDDYFRDYVSSLVEQKVNLGQPFKIKNIVIDAGPWRMYDVRFERKADTLLLDFYSVCRHRGGLDADGELLNQL